MLEQIGYHRWNCAYRISNGVVELVVLADVGPRVIRYGFVGEGNIFHEVSEQAGLTGGDEFRLYGGHRLWVWPEIERTYFPDNGPVSVSRNGLAIRFTAPVEVAFPGTKLQKDFEIVLDDASSRVTITHRVTNHDNRAAELAVWCPTMMRAGGRAILPLPPRTAMDKDHYQSVGLLALWSFTDFADPRWTIGTEFLQLRQESHLPNRFQEQMTGTYNPAGWGAYYSDGSLFVKQAAVLPGTYPDFGCNFEVFTNPEFLELETLSPVVNLPPGESCQHDEVWSLFRGVPPGSDQAWLHSTVVPLVSSLRTT